MTQDLSSWLDQAAHLRLQFFRMELLRQSDLKLVFATDNDIFKMSTAPQKKVIYADPLRPFLSSSNEIKGSALLPAIVDRIASFVYGGLTQRNDECAYILPGHDHELVGILTAIKRDAILQIEQGERIYGDVEPATLKRFQAVFLHRGLQGGESGEVPTIDSLMAAVPEHMQWWLGYGSALLEAERAQRLFIPNHEKLKPLALVQKAVLEDVSATEELKLRTAIWLQALLKTQHEANRKSKQQLQMDAVALAHLEWLNATVYLPKRQLLVLLSGADHLRNAAKLQGFKWLQSHCRQSGISVPSQLDDLGELLVLHPLSLLDECHLRFTGNPNSTEPSWSGEQKLDSTGRLSQALDQLLVGSSPLDIGAQSSIANAKAFVKQFLYEIQNLRPETLSKNDEYPKLLSVQRGQFVEELSRFVQGAVLDRIKEQTQQKRKAIRQLMRVFEDLGGEHGFQQAMAEQGSHVLSESADIGLLVMPTPHLRGSRVLYFDQHPVAQTTQLWTIERQIEQIRDPVFCKRLQEESSGNRYTLILLHAQCFMRTGHWLIARKLCRFAVQLAKIMGDDARREGKPFLDGREAYLLLGVTERYAGHGSDFCLTQSRDALFRARQLSDAHEQPPWTDFHSLRVQSELLSCDLASVFRTVRDTRRPDAVVARESTATSFEKLSVMSGMLSEFLDAIQAFRLPRFFLESNAALTATGFSVENFNKVMDQIRVNTVMNLLSVGLLMQALGKDSRDDIRRGLDALPPSWLESPKQSGSIYRQTMIRVSEIVLSGTTTSHTHLLLQDLVDLKEKPLFDYDKWWYELLETLISSY